MNGALERLVFAARRRVVTNLALSQSSVALALALAGAAILLLTGTQILSWYWPVILFAGALAFGLWRVRGRIPASYVVAQRVDRSLNLHDSLSTAWHFSGTDEDVLSDEVRRAQRKQAETTAAEVAVEAAVPYEFPKSLRWCVALGVLVAGLFAARYGVQKSLDLSRPLVTFSLDPFGSSNVQEAKNQKKANTPMDEFMQQVSLQPPDQQQNGLDPAPDSALGVVDTPDVNNDNAQPVSGKTKEKGPGGEDGEKVEGSENPEGASGGDKNANDGATQTPNNEGKPQAQQNAKNQQAQQPGENSSMLDKMRDAMANLMNKMTSSKQQQENGQQKAENSKGGQPSGNARQQQAKSGQQTKGQPGSDQQAQNQQSGNEDQDMDPSQSQQGKAGDKNSQQASNQENKSGMGKQDGDKDVKLAEQMSAMGKISEIIGKRNANLQGEVMIETSSSKQQLKTQYAQRLSKHADSGGEIHRDEVPLIYQNYVQHYFEEVRKGTGSAPTAFAPAAKPGKSSPAAAGAADRP